MAKGKFSSAQNAHLNTYIPEYVSKLDAGVQGILLTRWKQATATKALESEAFRDLDVSEISRNVWSTMIVRKFTNYFHQVYKKSHSESLPSTAVKGNPLLKFTSVLSGRQMFARDMHGSIIDVSRQRASDTGENEAAAYQHALKGMWDALSSDEKSEWDAKAEDECGDIEILAEFFFDSVPKTDQSQFGCLGAKQHVEASATRRCLSLSALLSTCFLPVMTKSKNKEVKGVADDVRAVVEGLDPAGAFSAPRTRDNHPDGASISTQSVVPLCTASQQLQEKRKLHPYLLPEKSPKKTKTSKRKADTVKAEATEYTLESDSSVEILDNSPRPKKKKRSKVPAAASDDDDPVEMAFCVYVETPAPAILNVRKGNQKPLPPKTTTLGPYEFISSISYPDFLRVVADGCRTKPANLDRNSMQWKYDRPASAKPKPLTNETGFTVMIKQLKARHKDYAFSVFMSPPNDVKEELPWIRLGAEQDDGNDGGGPPDFDYNIDDLKAGGSVLSIRDQIAGIDSASNEQFNQLLEKYPINNSPLFPGKRIYHNETGYFDLTDIKLRVWAVATAKGQATIDKAPASSHFFKSQIIRPKNVSAVPELSVPSFDPLVNMFMMNPMLQM
ncbi:hypothetical protein DFH09DRAFT_1274490, partial [Mycena vulgaris]